MSKGKKQRGNRESKKPKKKKKKILATAAFTKGRTPLGVGDVKTR